MAIKHSNPYYTKKQILMRRNKRKISKGNFTTEITKMSHDCRGIATVSGKTTFIAGALPNETVTFKYLKQNAQFAEGYAVGIIAPSKDRIAAKCAHFGLCGGCRFQQLSQQTQIDYKTAALKDQLHHFGQVSPSRWLMPIKHQPYGYRTKARLGVKHVPKKGGVLVGFRELDGRFIADIECCHILDARVGLKITALKTLINQLDAKATIPQIEVAMDEQHTALIFRHLAPLSEQDRAMLSQFAQAHSIWLYLQPKGPQSITRLWPNEIETKLSYTIQPYDVSICFEPQHFTQVNHVINQKMINQAISLLELNEDDRVLDLFCGMGNFTLPMATKAKHVTGIEVCEAMVSLGTENAKQNQLHNVSFYQADLFNENAKAPFMHETYDKILLDPARSGAKEILAVIDRFKARRIVYVSCNPATLARDAGLLVNQKNYTLTACGVIDMFPHTAHVESMAVFDLCR